MGSSSDVESDVKIKIQETLVSINDITLKIKKELEMIDELVRENGRLHTAVSEANRTLSKKIYEMGMSIEEVTNQSKQKDRLQLDLTSITSTIITEKLLNHMDG